MEVGVVSRLSPPGRSSMRDAGLVLLPSAICTKVQAGGYAFGNDDGIFLLSYGTTKVY